jgi:hypothetical protein
VTGVAIKRFFDWLDLLWRWWTVYSAFSGSFDCVAWSHRIDSAPLIDRGLALGLVVATDTAFISNRLASAHQIHKFDL